MPSGRRQRIVLMPSDDADDDRRRQQQRSHSGDTNASSATSTSSNYVAMEEDADIGTRNNSNTTPNHSQRSSDNHSLPTPEEWASTTQQQQQQQSQSQSQSQPLSSSPIRPPNLLTSASSGDASALDEPPHLNRHFVLELISWYRNRSWFKKILTGVVFVTACIVYADLFGFFWPDSKIHAGLELFLQWMEDNSLKALFAFVGVFILTTLIFVPPFIMVFGAGFVFVKVDGFGWGIALAMVACFTGSSIGAVIAFARARYMTRDLVKIFAKRYPIIRGVDRGLKRSGFKVMLLLRLCSIIPFSALNYIGGVTGVQLSAFICSLVGILPSHLLTVFFGATAGSLKNSDIAADYTMSNIIWMSVTGACGVLAILITIYFARKEIKKELEREEDSERHSSLSENWSEHDVESGRYPSQQQQQNSQQRRSEEWWWVWA